MPTLPRATSQQTLNNRSPNVKKDSAAYRVPGESIAQLGQAVSTVGQKFKDLQNLQEYTTASTEGKRRLRELEEKAQQDPDIYTMDTRYKEEIQKVRNDALKMVSDVETQTRFAEEFDNFAQTKEFNIRSISRTKQVDKAKSSLINDIDQSKLDFYGASSPLERKQLADQTKSRLDEYARLGVISEEDATKQKIAWENEVRIGQVSYDASINPELAKDNIEKGVYTLNPKEKEEALNEVASLVKKRQERKEVDLFRSYNANEEKVVQDILAGNKTVSEIDRLELLGSIGASEGISKEFAVAARRAITSSGSENPEQVFNDYNDLLDDFVSLKIDKNKKRTKSSLEDLMKFRVKVMDKYSKGSITAAQMNDFLGDISKAYGEKLDERAKEDLKASDPTPWHVLYDWTKNFSSDDLKASRARIASEMMSRIRGGEDPHEAVRSSIESEKLNTNELYRIFKNAKPGETIDTPAGPVKFVRFAEDGEPIIEAIK